MSLKEKFVFNFIDDGRWHYIVDGLKVTLEVTFFAVLLGIALGVIIAIVRSTYDKNKSSMRGFSKFIVVLLNFICKIYLTVIRGTPVVVQLMIMYFIVLVSSNNKVLVAVLAFGFNSAAYVAEIFRSGIMSIDEGQFEAGRSLGFNYVQTMGYIIIPQAFKNVLPALGNELITLLKETSVVTVIGLRDLTKGALIIQSKTYQAFVPFFAIAAMYLVMVLGLSWLMGKLERRMRQSDLR